MKKKLAFIITKSEIGGAQKFVFDQIQILTNHYDLYIVTNRNGWLIRSTVDKVKANYLDIRIESFLSLSFLISLIKFLKSNKIDTIVCNSANAGFYGRLAGFFCNCKCFYVSHGWSAIYNGGKLSFVFKLIERFLASISHSILCISTSDYKIASDTINISSQKLKLIPNCVFPQDTINTNIKYPQEPIKLLTIARLNYPKRVDLLIESVEQLYDNVTLTIVGDGPEKEKLEEIVKKRNIENVFFKGEIQDFSDFKSFDIFILLSDSEGLPMSALEAMSAGLPLILSNVGGCPELIENNGVLVENNPVEVIKSIQTVIDNIESYSANSSKKFDKQFNLINKKEEYLDFYLS